MVFHKSLLSLNNTPFFTPSQQQQQDEETEEILPSPKVRKFATQWLHYTTIHEDSIITEEMTRPINKDTKIYSGSYDSLKRVPKVHKRTISDLFFRPADQLETATQLTSNTDNVNDNSSTLQKNNENINPSQKTISPPQTPNHRKARRLSRIFSIRLNDQSINEDNIIRHSQSSPNIAQKALRRRSLPVIPNYDKLFLSPSRSNNDNKNILKTTNPRYGFIRRRSADDLQQETARMHSEIIEAIKQNQCKRVKSIYKKCSFTENDEMLLLKEASILGCTKCIKILIRSGCSVNSTDDEGWTAMHYAIKSDNFDAVKALLSCNANLNIMNFDGQSPLHIAVSNENLYIVHELIKCGADPMICASGQPTPFQLAIDMKKKLILDYFIMLPCFLVGENKEQC